MDPVIVVTGTRGIPGILGGVETHCEELLPRIVARGYQVVLVRRKNYVKDRLTSFKGVRLCDIPNVKIKSFEAIIHTFRAIWKARWTYKADIVHIHSIGPALLTPFARALGLKIVFTHHGPDYEREKWGKVAKYMLRTGERFGCIFAHQVIVISNAINATIKQKYGRDDAHFIPNGVPAPTLTDDTAYIEELNIKPRKFIFAMGRFVPEKNFHLLIHAYLNLKPAGYRLVIAGDADMEDAYSRALKSFAKENDIILTGFIKGNKLFALLSNAALFVLPSSHEGLPIALLEAMSYGLPVLASDISANKEVPLPPSCYFKLTQRRRHTVPEKLMQRGNRAVPHDANIENLTEALSYQLKNLTRPVYDLSAYNWDRIAEQTEQAYRQCLSFIKFFPD